MGALNLYLTFNQRQKQMRNDNLGRNKFLNTIVAFTLFLLQSNFIYAQGVIINALPHGATTVSGTTTIDYHGHTLNVTAPITLLLTGTVIILAGSILLTISSRTLHRWF